MKLFKLFCFSALALAIASCASAPEVTEVQEGPYTITTIAKNVYHIQDCNDANPSGETYDADGNQTHFNNCSDLYLFVGKEKALLIDLSNYIKWADDAVESLQGLVASRIGDLPLEITFTHNHGDHTGMLPAFIDNPDVKFLLPSIDFQRLASRFHEGSYEFYDEGYEFDLGGMKLATVLVPGHTAGSMVFFLEGQNMLFSGDAIGSGHGVWIFNTAGFENFIGGIDHLVQYIEDKANGIDKDALLVYGGHYWQKDWFPDLADTELGMQYIYEMQEVVAQIKAGTATAEPSGLGRQGLDTYFKNGHAILTWSEEQAAAWRETNK